MNSERQNLETALHPFTAEKIIDDVLFQSVDSLEEIELDNSFVKNEYDFQKGFYRGEFEFPSPLTGEMISDTPEAYGRHRIVASLLAEVLTRDVCTVYDIGSGTLDIARTIPKEYRRNIQLHNTDISGPWATRDGHSALERGTESLLAESNGRHGYKQLVNIQHDFNRGKWPIVPSGADIVVSNMALHHISPDRKHSVISALYNSLKPGGVLILNDVYTKVDDRAMLTTSGARGPSECKGHPVSFNEAFTLFQEVGFIIDEIAEKAHRDETAIGDDDIVSAYRSTNQSMPISNSVWFTVLRKEQ